MSYPSYFDPSGRLGAAITDSSFTPVTVFHDRHGGLFIHQGPYPSAAKLERDIDALRAGRLTGGGDARAADRPAERAPTIVAGERSRRPGGEPALREPAGADRPRARPVRRGPRGPHAAGALRAARRTEAAPDSPGWRVRVVPNLYPALSRPRPRRAAAPAAQRAGPGAAAGGTPQELFVSLPATGAHEVIVNGPQPVLSLAELPREQVIAAVEVWRERMRAHERSAYVQLIVNERREAGASLPHTHAQLYALDFVPGAVARERERSGAYTTRTMGQSLLGDLVAEEVRRGERIVAIDEEAVLIAPYASRLPFQLMLAPRRPRAALRGGRAVGRGAAARRAVPPGAPPRLEPAAEPVGAHRPARRRALLLADRRAAAADPPRRARAVDRAQPQHRRARARRGRCCARPERARRRLAASYAAPSMAPEERFVPRFAAEPPQEELPYGRWEERLSEELLAAALALEAEQADLGEPGRIVWYPDRTLARAHLRAGDRAHLRRVSSCSATCASSRPRRTASRASSPPRSTSPTRPPSATPTGGWTCATR